MTAPRSSIGGSEHQDTVDLLGPIGQLVHRAAMTPFSQFVIGDAPGIQASAANTDLSSPPNDRPEHELEVVVALRDLLTGLSNIF